MELFGHTFMKIASLIMSVGLVGISIFVPISMFFARRRIYLVWAKIVSIVLSVFGLGTVALDYIFWCRSMPWRSHVIVGMAHALLGGICIGLALTILIARPYQVVAGDKT